MCLPRSVSDVQRFEVRAEIRKLIAGETGGRKRAAIQEAWAIIAQELRIDRPQAAPVFKVNASLINSDEDAIMVIADHIATSYAPPNFPTTVPPWNTNHGVSAIELEESVGLATGAMERGKSSDPFRSL